MTHLTEALHIPDTQSERDERHVAIQRVGVKGVRYPLTVRVGGAEQSTAARWTLDVALPAEQKGTHMSRFVAWLEALDAPMDAAELHRRHIHDRFYDLGYDMHRRLADMYLTDRRFTATY